jgi:NCS2 family nucleobase:cation symporter-2
LSYIGIVKYLSRIWSDLVSGSMILMVGLAIAGQGARLLISQGPGWPLIFSVILALLAGIISLKGKGLISTLPSLIIISLGYAVFIALGRFNWSLINELPTFTIPNILPYGLELPSLGLIVTMIIVNLMSILNVYGNLKGYSAAVLDREVDPKDVKSSFIVFSIIETALAGFLGVPGLVAYSESIGVITMTRVASRSFLMISSTIFILLGFLGPLGGFMAAMPEPVAGAILLGIASTVIGSGADIWSKSKFSRREIFIVGFSIFLSLGLSLQPDTFWDKIPRLVATVFSNPSITVIFSVIALEQIFFRK